MTRGTTDDDIIKATLQSLAYQTRDVIETMQKDTKIRIPLLKVDGGAAMNQYLMQFQADLLAIPLERAANLESTALGAAFLAGLAVGYWQSKDQLAQLFSDGQRFDVLMDDKERDKLYQGWRNAVAATQYFARLD